MTLKTPDYDTSESYVDGTRCNWLVKVSNIFITDSENASFIKCMPRPGCFTLFVEAVIVSFIICLNVFLYSAATSLPILYLYTRMQTYIKRKLFYFRLRKEADCTPSLLTVSVYFNRVTSATTGWKST